MRFPIISKSSLALGCGHYLVIPRIEIIIPSAFMTSTLSKIQPAPEQLYVDFHGIKMTVTGDMDVHTADTLRGRAGVEETEFSAIRENIGENDIVVDIGAGTMACSLVAAHQRPVRVIAFEPSPALFPLALSNLDANPSLHVEAHFGTAVWPEYGVASADLRLPGGALDEASFDDFCPADDGQRVPVSRIEPAWNVLRQYRPTVVIVEASGMSCPLAKVIAASGAMRPRVLICRLRANWEGLDNVQQTISVLQIAGFSLVASYLRSDVLVFQDLNKIGYSQSQ